MQVPPQVHSCFYLLSALFCFCVQLQAYLISILICCMYFIIFFLSFQYGAKIKRICFYLATPQSTLSTAPLYGSLICFSLRRGGTQCRSGGFVQDNDLNAHFFSHPSVDFVDSSPLWEPYMPLLEERCPKGGVVVSCGTAPLTSLFSTTVGDQWSPLRQYYTVPKFKKEKSV